MCLHQTAVKYLQELSLRPGHNHCQSSTLALSCSWWSYKFWQQKLPLSGLAASAAKLWKSLPRLDNDTDIIRQLTKNYTVNLFCLAYRRASWLFGRNWNARYKFSLGTVTTVTASAHCVRFLRKLAFLPKEN